MDELEKLIDLITLKNIGLFSFAIGMAAFFFFTQKEPLYIPGVVTFAILMLGGLSIILLTDLVISAKKKYLYNNEGEQIGYIK